MGKKQSKDLVNSYHENLDPSINYPYLAAKRVFEPNNVFLTGATGLLGANLLGDLLEHTSANIFCLVRGSDVDDGKKRLKLQLQFYGLWQGSYNKRVMPVIGDLELPQLGLSDELFQQIAEEVDVIYHCGASTNLVLPYSQLYAVNVASTESLLRMAGTCRTKPFHHVSTISVLPKFDRHKRKINIMLEGHEPSNEVSRQGGYAASKIVAERLVRQARKRGLPASIYRIGRIMGHSENGRVASPAVPPALIWKASIILKKCPDVDKQMSFVPVDFVSKAIGHLSRNPALVGKTFHINHRNSVSWKFLFGVTESYGYPLEVVPLDQWVEGVKGEPLKRTLEGHNEAVEYSLLCSVADSFFGHKNPEISTYNLLEGLNGSSVVCPMIDERMLRGYLYFFEQVGFTPSPPSSLVDKWRAISEARKE